MINVKVNDREFLGRYQALMRRFPGAVEKAVKDSAIYGTRLLKQAAPVKTGALRRNFFFRRIADQTWQIYNDIKYALAVDQGYKAHIIRPKRKKWLYWTATGKRRISASAFEGGKPSRASKPGFDFYALKVLIPRFSGRKFTQKVLPSIAERMKRLLIVNIGRVVRGQAA